jgi:hypothetical protein
VAIIFLTGVSTAGKTTLHEGLRKDPDLAHVEFHDIDEDGVPAAGSGNWRQFRVELLLHEAAARFRSEGKSTVICGVTIPHEAIESGSYPEDIPVHFVLLEVPMAVMRKRLDARIGGRVEPDDLEFLTQYNRRLSHLLRRSVLSLRNGHRVSHPGQSSRVLSKIKVRQQVKSLILDLLAQF